MRPKCLQISILAIFAVVAISTIAFAHAVLISSTPKDNTTVKTAPKNAVLRFDVRIEKKVSQVTLSNAMGQNITLKRPSSGYSGGSANEVIFPLPKLKPGKY